MISVEARRIENPDPSLPALALQVIELVESYMIWVGVARGSAEDAVQSGNLGKDWACAMPSLSPNVRISNQKIRRRSIVVDA